jgi:osmotically-inducible protein OsmY
MKGSFMQNVTRALTIPLVFCAASIVHAQQPDNTAVNQRDRNSSEPTADQQKMNATDRQLSASIRKQIVHDKSLSTYAHNIKIISQNGEVTLKGPVKSDSEKQAVLAKARATVGNDQKVHDEISVKQ